MSLRKWNDSGVADRGAKGIDGTKGENYVHPFRDRGAEEAMYGRSWDRGGKADGSEHSGSKDTKPMSESADYDTK